MNKNIESARSFNILNKDIRSPDEYIDAFIDQYVSDPQEETGIRTLYQHYQ